MSTKSLKLFCIRYFLLQNNDLVTNMNRNIYAMDVIEEKAQQELIDAEELNMGLLPDDDDYGDNDGDEQFY